MKFIFALAALLALIHCRGRDFAKPMPRFTGTASDTLIIFQSADEEYGRGTRIHFIDPATGSGSELDSKAVTPTKEIMNEPHLVFAAQLVGQSGKSSRLISKAEEQKRVVAPYTVSQLSPDNALYLRATPGVVTLVRTDGSAEYLLREDWADCAWQTASEFVCLVGKYQERRAIIAYDFATRRSNLLYEIKSKAKLENLRLVPGGTNAVFTENSADSVAIYRLDIKNKACTKIADFTQRYIFGLEVSPQGIVAARIVDSKHPEGKLNPYDIWVSAAFGAARAPGYLLNLKALESPGFFSGKGFIGVDSFAFSPDGKSLAVLMSGEDDCRMVDEGGNYACRKDIYIVDRDKPQVRRLTEFQIQSAERLQWRKFTK